MNARSIQPGNVNTVAAGAFGFVEHFVRFAHKRVEIPYVAALAARYSEGGGDADAVSGKRKRQRTEQFAEPIDRHFDVGGAYVRNHDQEFVTAEPPAHVGNAREPAQGIGEGPQHRVASFVPEGVVDFLEGIEIA